MIRRIGQDGVGVVDGAVTLLMGRVGRGEVGNGQLPICRRDDYRSRRAVQKLGFRHIGPGDRNMIETVFCDNDDLSRRTLFVGSRIAPVGVESLLFDGLVPVRRDERHISRPMDGDGQGRTGTVSVDIGDGITKRLRQALPG